MKRVFENESGVYCILDAGSFGISDGGKYNLFKIISGQYRFICSGDTIKGLKEMFE